MTHLASSGSVEVLLTQISRVTMFQSGTNPSKWLEMARKVIPYEADKFCLLTSGNIAINND
jgi:hypothetical protein